MKLQAKKYYFVKIDEAAIKEKTGVSDLDGSIASGLAKDAGLTLCAPPGAGEKCPPEADMIFYHKLLFLFEFFTSEESAQRIDTLAPKLDAFRQKLEEKNYPIVRGGYGAELRIDPGPEGSEEIRITKLNGLISRLNRTRSGSLQGVPAIGQGDLEDAGKYPVLVVHLKGLNSIKALNLAIDDIGKIAEQELSSRSLV